MLFNEEFFAEFAEAWENLSAEEKRAAKEKLVKLMKLRVEGEGRKAEVLRLFLENETGLLISEISGRLGISDKNVSSILSYLRKDGHKFNVNWEGRRILVRD